MNSSVTTKKQLAQLDRALDAGTLGDVAGIVSDLSPGDVAYRIASYPPRVRQVLWSLLEPEQEADVLNELPEELRNQFLVEMDPKALAVIVGQLDDDDVADILHDLPDSITEQVLGIMDEADRMLDMGFEKDI